MTHLPAHYDHLHMLLEGHFLLKLLMCIQNIYLARKYITYIVLNTIISKNITLLYL